MDREKTIKIWGVAAGILGALSVGMGAFATHGLKDILAPERLVTYQTGVTYMQLHVIAITLVVVLMVHAGPLPWLRRAAAFYAAGIALFTGSLSLLAIWGVTWLGAVAPLGGIAFLAGWLSLAAVFSQPRLLRREA